jgi:hypothetical protein|tara:strand:+ start:190 stop:477 length:288 start_codon:yes stop_codon:yes gene_type:complete
MNVDKDLEDMIDKWSPLLHNGLQAQKGLLDIALIAYDPLFEKGTNGKQVFEAFSNTQLNEVIKGLEEDIIPMFKENNYDEGVKKAKVYLKKLQKG